MEHKDKTFLQGFWLKIHFDARFTDLNPHLSKCFENTLINNAIRFPCDECRPHFIRYLQENPITGTDSYFAWTVEFHNAVNRRLGKKEVSLPEALRMYDGGKIDICSSCNSSSKKPVEPEANEVEEGTPTRNRLVLVDRKLIFQGLEPKKESEYKIMY